VCRLKKERRRRRTEEVRKTAGKNQEVCLSLRKRMNEKRFQEICIDAVKREKIISKGDRKKVYGEKL
jgi:hypothetical protein